jgi:DNA-binding CsgD family transcriptional regulator/tetratricopeptide (TPR) repeat protein
VSVDEAVATGRAALQAGQWEDARIAFEAAVAEHETPEALDGLAEVRYWQGDYAGAIELRERAYAGFRARGETRYPALLAAYYLAFDYAAVYGNDAASSGWLERGKRLAEVSGDCPERGWVELACAVSTDDVVMKERHVAAAREIAQRFGDSDLEFDALAYEGVCLVERGRLDEGMRKLDEAAAAARGGEVQGFTAVGEIYCKMLLACEMALDVRRAEQWTEAANSLAGRSNAAWASAICRMHYGGILTAAGRWAEAEDELETSVRIYDRGYRALRSGAVVRLANLRVLQGRLEEAEQLLPGYEHDPYAVRPLARLHLARGETELAATRLRRHLGNAQGTPLQAPALALLAEVELTAGHVEESRAIAGRLAEIAAATPGPLLRALAEFATGSAADGVAAVAHLENALAGFVAAGLPLEEARTRLRLARRVSATTPEVAVAEARTALSTFDRLGATPDADAAAALLRSLGVRDRTGPKDVGVLSQREQEVLQLLGLGLSNPEIAARLFISRKTAAHHVSNVLTKLNLRNRAEAAAYASQHARIP